MKYKNLLLATTLASLLIIGCGDKNNNNRLEDSLFIQKNASENVIRAKVFDYMLDHHLDENLGPIYRPGTVGSSITQGRGTISKNMVSLINTTWKKLSETGLSGYFVYAAGSPVEVSSLNSNARIDVLHRGGEYNKSLYIYENGSYFDARFVKALTEINYSRLLKDPDAITHLSFLDVLAGLEYKGEVFYQYKEIELPIRLPDPLPSDERSSWGFDIKTLGDYKEWEQLCKQWDQIIINCLAEDPFFMQFFKKSVAPADSSGSLALHAGRTGRLGLDATGLNLHGVQGSYIDLGLPVYIQLKGTVDGHTHTADSQGVVAYRIGNALIGAAHTYANTGVGFGEHGRQSETSVLASYNFGACFVEGQLGHVSVKDVNFKDWSGIRSQLTLGYDFNWGAPFVQAVHRDFGKTTDTAAYAGVELNLSEIKGDTYTFTTNGIFKVGYHSEHNMVGMLELKGSLNLNNGVSFSSSLTLGTLAETTAGLCINLSQ